METQGFYKFEDGNLQYAPKAVMSLTFSLFEGSHYDYVYPVQGWWWFDSEEEAKQHFGIK